MFTSEGKGYPVRKPQEFNQVESFLFKTYFVFPGTSALIA